MSALADARQAEVDLRNRLADAITEQRLARLEAERLRARAALDGADETMATAAARQAQRAERLEVEVDDLRKALRKQEALVANLEADSDGA